MKRTRSESSAKDEIRLDTTPGRFDDSEKEGHSPRNRAKNRKLHSPHRRSHSPSLHRRSRSPRRMEKVARMAYRDLRTHLKERGIRNLPPPPPRWQPLSSYDRRSVARDVYRIPRHK